MREIVDALTPKFLKPMVNSFIPIQRMPQMATTVGLGTWGAVLLVGGAFAIQVGRVRAGASPQTTARRPSDTLVRSGSRIQVLFGPRVPAAAGGGGQVSVGTPTQRGGWAFPRTVECLQGEPCFCSREARAGRRPTVLRHCSHDMMGRTHARSLGWPEFSYFIAFLRSFIPAA